MFALPGVSPPALPCAEVWHERSECDSVPWIKNGIVLEHKGSLFIQKHEKWICFCLSLRCGGDVFPHGTLDPAQGGPCTLLGISYETIRMSLIHHDIAVLTFRPLHYSLPSPYVMQWKPEECLPSTPGPFPLRPNTHISKNIKNHIYLQIGETRGLQLWKMSKKRYHWDWSLCFQAFNSHLWSQSWNFLITSFYCKMSLTIYDTGCLLLDLFLLWGIL